MKKLISLFLIFFFGCFFLRFASGVFRHDTVRAPDSHLLSGSLEKNSLAGKPVFTHQKSLRRALHSGIWFFVLGRQDFSSGLSRTGLAWFSFVAPLSHRFFSLHLRSPPLASAARI
ncbi:MAG: hypothetical protein HYZ52_03660 [Candidatus Omnitrophica bacterium]|nr:hypothetical protein [Candidatus Omnitrophota bacterium]